MPLFRKNTYAYLFELLKLAVPIPVETTTIDRRGSRSHIYYNQDEILTIMLVSCL